MENFASLAIETKNECFANATVYYYSEEYPTEEGNYWYYDKDGIACIWQQEEK